MTMSEMFERAIRDAIEALATPSPRELIADHLQRSLDAAADAPSDQTCEAALRAIIQMDDDAIAAHGKPGANLNGYGLVDLFDCVNHPFGSGEHKQQPYRSNQLNAALSDARVALSQATIAREGKQ